MTDLRVDHRAVGWYGMEFGGALPFTEPALCLHRTGRRCGTLTASRRGRAAAALTVVETRASMRMTGRPAIRCGGGALACRSVIVPSAADGASRAAEKHEDEPDYEDNDADRPQNGDLRDEPDDEKYDAEGDHLGLLKL
jgi:hypothetical protein